MQRFIACACAASINAAAVAVLLAAAAAPAGAESRSGAARKAYTSTYLAGYETTTGSLKTASVRFKVPKVVCPDGDARGISLGLGNEDVPGSPTLAAYVLVMCLFGAPAYEPWIVVGSEQNFADNLAFQPGHEIIATVTQTPNQITAKLKNKTTGASISASGTPLPDTKVLFGALSVFQAGGSNPLPVPDFGKATLRKPKFYGYRLKRKVA